MFFCLCLISIIHYINLQICIISYLQIWLTCNIKLIDNLKDTSNCTQFSLILFIFAKLGRSNTTARGISYSSITFLRFFCIFVIDTKCVGLITLTLQTNTRTKCVFTITTQYNTTDKRTIVVFAFNVCIGTDANKTKRNDSLFSEINSSKVPFPI